jgi:hypothetical protein
MPIQLANRAISNRAVVEFCQSSLSPSLLNAAGDNFMRDHDKQSTKLARAKQFIVFHCLFHPGRPALHLWHSEHLCDECWNLRRAIESVGF